jgi:acyl transferase domain-containing protein
MIQTSDAIAVVGLAVRAPHATDRHAFWANVLAGRECLSTVDDKRDVEGWVPVKGVLDGADEFDADFFGFSPREAEITDPQQRVLLELVWHALEDAGHTPHSAGRVGVFASTTQSRYDRLLEEANPRLAETVGDLQLRIATESDFSATRAAYRLGLHGPALTVQTACSSSLVGVHVAVGSLLSGDCDTAVVGGVTITLPLRGGYRFQPGSILSPDGHCRAFDAAAAGTVPGNGGAAAVLRRLDDALASGDDIYAVILGSAINNDGAQKAGFTAPSAAGQQAVITAALRMAEVEPDQVGMIEAHGTGTPLGDPIEVGALRKVFGPPRPDGTWCGLSATKSNVGHLDAAAGIIGFANAVLSVHSGLIPPVAGFTAPNPDLRLDASPLRVVTSATPWPVAGRRYAGVSAFGVGGTNAHVVLASPPPVAERAVASGETEWTLSARDPAALDEMARALADHLEANPELDPADVAFTLAQGRASFAYRRTVTGPDRAALVARLRTEARTVHNGHTPSDVDGRRVHLPGYPFQRGRFWPSPPPASPQPGEWLPALFAEVLGRAPAHERESFFDLGGDSLMAIQLISRVSAVTGVEPDLEQFFDEPTVAGLVAQIERQERV